MSEKLNDRLREVMRINVELVKNEEQLRGDRGQEQVKQIDGLELEKNFKE